jgi:mannose-1-phosphate guanylyltransferase/mannose-1-phosphate guanylyltransferase/phosphomannomutase
VKAVILAAGKGSRLLPYSQIIPKPLMPIGKDASGAFVPIIDQLIRQIRRAGVTEIVVVVNYLAESILRHLQDGNQLGVKIAYVYQGELDGNGGAFYRAQHLVAGDDVIITDADNFLSDDAVFEQMVMRHRATKAELTVGVCHVDNPSKFAIIKTDSTGKPTGIFEKPTDHKEWGTLAKSGMMVLSAALAALPRDISLAPSGEYTTTGIVQHCLTTGKRIELFDIAAGFRDIGTWNEYGLVLQQTLGS